MNMNSQAARYAPMNLAIILGYPNRIPHVDWKTYLPIFKDQKGDDSVIHLFMFYKHIHKLGVGWHEDSLMRLFRISLQENDRSWYEGLPSGSLSSLKYIHTVFHEHFKRHYPSLLLLQYCCTHDKEFIENVKDECGDDQYLDEEFLDILHEYSTQKERQTNCHHIQENSQQLVMSSLTEVDISQNSDSTSYFSFHETSDSL